MLNRWWIGCAFALSLGACRPATSENGAETHHDPTHEGRGSVWIVDGPNGGRLHLCGTIHILRKSDYPLPAAYQKAYDDSDELILELPPQEAGGSDSLAGRMRAMAAFDKNITLETVLPTQEWQRVQAWASNRGLPLSLVNPYQPWYAALLITAVEYQKLGAGQEFGVDTFFEKQAQKDRKPCQGLETVDFQLGLFAGMTGEKQREMLQKTLDEVDRLAADYDEMLKAWRRGDLAALDALLLHELNEYPDLAETFLHARNRAWIPKLEMLLKEGRKLMVLVGAGHLGGAEGLIPLLEARGYKARHATDP